MCLGRGPVENVFMAETPVVVQKAYEFSLWMIQKAGSFPKSYRFSIGDRLVNGVLEILMRLVDAAYSRDKERLLIEVNAMLNRIRFLLRIRVTHLAAKTSGFCGGRRAAE